ncbi:MAG: hypothetical protein LWX56_05515 [Ignavibacteria bacterium]|nr:hypothetical protein [Ignavibacteria bacterium]
MRKLLIIALLLPFLITGCGEPDVSLDSGIYEPKIAIEGFLFASQTVQNIKIRRNFPLGTTLDLSKICLTPSDNDVHAYINGIPLLYDSTSQTYYNKSILIEYGKKYTLEVAAKIDGKSLSTQAVTVVPNQGFQLLNKKDMGDVVYRGEQINFLFKPSPGTDFYAFVYMAINPDLNAFIFKNPYKSDIDTSDVVKNFNDYKTSYDVLMDLGSMQQNSFSTTMEFYRVWFYGKYKTVAYACDKNFKDFLLSAPNVAEFDGNFHEPKIILQGDGIGVFASAIRDTVIFNLVK